MPDFLTTAFSSGAPVSPLELALRLFTALGFGIIIAGLYHFTRPKEAQGTSFPMTILMLCILIAMVTQVIGDSVARAFSLVGALSIVRFRTVVRDTQDTAYVILAVIVGMAVGARNLWVAVIGLAVVALAEMLRMALRKSSADAPVEYSLRLRVSLDHDPDTLLTAAFGTKLEGRELVSLMALDKGEGIEVIWNLHPREAISPAEILRRLVNIPGVRSVRLVRRGLDEE